MEPLWENFYSIIELNWFLPVAGRTSVWHLALAGRTSVWHLALAGRMILRSGPAREWEHELREVRAQPSFGVRAARDSRSGLRE
jgi:hypothetical protein